MEKTEKRKDKDGSYDHVFKYTGFFGLIQVLTMLVSVIRNKLGAILLSSTGMGLISIYNNVGGFLSNVSSLGISFSALRRLSELYDSNDELKIIRFISIIRTWSVWTAFIGVLLCLIFSPIISFWAFSDTSHIASVCMLSPMIAFMAITAGEIVVLKAMRHLKRIALSSVMAAIVTLLFTVPFYYFYGISGILPALVIGSAGVMFVHLSLSLPLYPWKTDVFSHDFLREGIGLLKIGLPYILAITFNTAISMAIPLFINRIGSLSDVGLYSMGYNLVLIYVGMLFSAVESDYFPRLSSVHNQYERMLPVVNRQVKVCVLLIAPFLVFFMFAMPWIIRLLYSSDFLPMSSMAILSSLHMYFKAMTLPVAYIALAKGDSKIFLLMEVVYDLILFFSVVGGYILWGIPGTGIAVALSGVFDWVMIYIIYGKRYGFIYDRNDISFLIIQFIFVFCSLILCLFFEGILKYILGVIVFVFSFWRSFSILRKELSLYTSLKKRIISRMPFGSKCEK